MFKIVLSSVTNKFLKKCHKEIYERLLNKIRLLSWWTVPNRFQEGYWQSW